MTDPIDRLGQAIKDRDDEIAKLREALQAFINAHKPHENQRIDAAIYHAKLLLINTRGRDADE